jgi:hypothetical protein
MVFCWPVRTYESSKRVEERLKGADRRLYLWRFLPQLGGIVAVSFFRCANFLAGKHNSSNPKSALGGILEFRVWNPLQVLVYEIGLYIVD